MARLTINGKTSEVNVDPSTPLLWAIREQVGLTGTKYGCGVAQCGACTVHVDGGGGALLRDAGQRRGRASRSPPSRASPPAASCTRCRRPGSTTRCPSAATARRA